MSVIDEQDTADFLEHYGVKGMKWGQRRAAKKLAKADAKWEKDAAGMKGFIKFNNMVADKMNGGRLDKVNNKPEFRNADFTKPENKKLYDKYLKEIGDQYDAAVKESARDYGTNPSGTRKITVTPDMTGFATISISEVRHSDLDGEMSFRAKLNAKGHIVESQELTEEDEAFLQQMDDTTDFLEHYGVKGMKWGVTRSHLKSTLGQRTAKVGKPSSEAKATAKVHSKAKSQKSLQALSNKELKDAIERMRLEQQYSQMSGGIDKTTQQRASAFIRSQLKGKGKQDYGTQITGDDVRGQVGRIREAVNKGRRAAGGS